MNPKHHHAGHRERLRARYRTHPETVTDHELLELLLFYAIPQKDTNELAHRLLERFGNLSGVLYASTDQIRCVEGMGEISSLMFPMMQDLFRRHMTERVVDVQQIPTSYSVEAIADRYLPIFERQTVERSMVIGLDSCFRVIGDSWVGSGTFDSSEIKMSDVSDFVTYNKPRYVILVHNHPSGIGLPSEPDFVATEQVGKFLSCLDVDLLDHLIFDGRGDYLSFYQSKYFELEEHPRYLVGIREPSRAEITPFRLLNFDGRKAYAKFVKNLQNKEGNS